MIYITGDCHGNFQKFSTKNFTEQKTLTKNDYVIVCGDFGGIWESKPSNREKYWIDWLNQKPFTTLFIDGNHENFNRIFSNEFSEIDFGQNKATQIDQSVLYLKRGQIYRIDGFSFFTFGGAISHDIINGIIDERDYATKQEFRKVVRKCRKNNSDFRINNVSWWADEQADYEIQSQAFNNINNNKIDFIITHAAPRSIALSYFHKEVFHDDRTEPFLESIKDSVDFKHWYFGHYHQDKQINDKFTCVYNNIIPIHQP